MPACLGCATTRTRRASRYPLRLHVYVSICLPPPPNTHTHTQVAPPVLIPRPETEELVEWVLHETTTQQRTGGGNGTGLRFLDIGCGTGAIGLALLKVCVCLSAPAQPAPTTHPNPRTPSPPPPNQALPPALAAQSACVALDPHPQAVALARRNAAALLGLASEGQYRVVQGRIEEEATMCVCMHACAHVSSFRSVPE